EIWIIEKQSNNINAVNLIDQRFVQEIGSLKAVDRTHGVVFAPAQISFLDGKTASVVLVGANAPYFIMGPTSNRIMEGDISALSRPVTVSAEFFNQNTWKTDLYLNKPVEINGKTASIGMITRNAQSFGASVVYTSLE